ncbi:MAG TPA: nitroreductase family protein [Microthrixaceae bacterium]|nr:nitroreductase family protein [Microthrixaceae bacterium]MCO5306398.1 nitroreductase family protein [Microthrixaceae bacterium]HPG13328.1 nitroreductase family protein [Microthrixaceae bacterium]HRW41302.1 nitroreductase family protein [Microthrixaceae bacterium]
MTRVDPDPASPDPADPGGRAAFSQVLASRRMCRDFKPDPVADDVLDRVLAAAFRAPAAGNTDALDLVVLTGADTARHWDVTLPADRRLGFRWPGLMRAPVLVEVIVDPAAYVERYSLPDKAHSGLGDGAEAWPVPFWFVDGGAAVMAVLLAAESEGLGALLFGVFGHEAAVRRALGVPAGRRVVATVALGLPAPGGRLPSRSARRGRPGPGRRIHRGGWAGQGPAPSG